MSGECESCYEHCLDCRCGQEIITCNVCGQILLSGKACSAFFSQGTSITCLKCGNKHVFGIGNKLIDVEEEMRKFEMGFAYKPKQKENE